MPEKLTPSQFLPAGVDGAGAAKLADSAIAPLVAAARGYFSILDKEKAKEVAQFVRDPSKLNTVSRSLGAATAGGEDVLVMPWHAQLAVATGETERVGSWQYRPSRPMSNAEGKPMKYAFLPGEPMVLDVHPAVPAAVAGGAAFEFVLVEGLLKADSAFSAWLAESGLDAEVLASAPSKAEARAIIHEHIANLHRSQRTLFIATASATTWREPAQWNQLRLRDISVMVAFDGDITTNRMVWNELCKALEFLRGRGAKPTFLLFDRPKVNARAVEAGLGIDEKIGLDDFLAKVGTWGEAKGLRSDQLPPEPSADTLAVLGQWRIHPDYRSRLQEFARETLADGSLAPANWVDRGTVGGSVVAAWTTRRPLWDEIRDGRLDEEADAANAASGRMQLDVAILPVEATPDETPAVYRISGPAHYLMAPPSVWGQAAKTGDLHVPTGLLVHPAWPPSPRTWDGWTRAVRANGTGADDERTWACLGWVPTEDGAAFVLPGQTLAVHARTEREVKIGITDPAVKRLGIPSTFRALSRDAFDAQTADAIARTVSIYSRLFTDPTAGAIALTAGLRPTIPLPSAVIVLIEGEQSGGKTFAAAHINAFWRARPVASMTDLVMGTADDTNASTEEQVATHLIWTMDDVAPDADERKAKSRQSTTATVARRIFNGASRKRMGQTGVPDARAVLVITAENEIPGQSFRARVWPIAVQKGKAYDEKVLAEQQQLMKGSVTPFGLAAEALIRSFLRPGASWTDLIGQLRYMRDQLREKATEELRALGVDSSAAARQAGKIADLGIVLETFKHLLADITDPEEDERYAGAYDALDRMWELLVLASVANADAQAQSNPGLVTLRGLSAALASGHAHLTNAVTPEAPPFADPHENQRAGWHYVAGAWRPRGTSVGKVGTRAGDGLILAMLEPFEAFREARKASPDILPGVLAKDSWAAAGNAGLLIDPPSPKLAKRTTRQSFRAESGVVRTSGVAVAWDVLRNPQLPEAENADDEEAA